MNRLGLAFWFGPKLARPGTEINKKARISRARDFGRLLDGHNVILQKSQINYKKSFMSFVNSFSYKWYKVNDITRLNKKTQLTKHQHSSLRLKSKRFYGLILVLSLSCVWINPIILVHLLSGVWIKTKFPAKFTPIFINE